MYFKFWNFLEIGNWKFSSDQSDAVLGSWCFYGMVSISNFQTSPKTLHPNFFFRITTSIKILFVSNPKFDSKSDSNTCQPFRVTTLPPHHSNTFVSTPKRNCQDHHRGWLLVSLKSNWIDITREGDPPTAMTRPD